MTSRDFRSLPLVFPAILLSLIAAWCAPVSAASDPSKARITGTASYRERIALTPTAGFEATLEDVSRADAPAKIIARSRKKNPGQVPIAFEIPYDTRRIDTQGKYVVRASIYLDGRLRFTGSQPYPVLTQGHRNKVSILMRSAGGIENTRWCPTRIGDQAVTVSGQQHEPWIVLDPRSKRVTGSGGCNRISGNYEAGPGTLRFDRMISTKMACPSLDTETAFLRALGDTRRYRVAGRTLELLDAGGRLLVRLEERNLR